MSISYKNTTAVYC